MDKTESIDMLTEFTLTQQNNGSSLQTRYTWTYQALKFLWYSQVFLLPNAANFRYLSDTVVFRGFIKGCQHNNLAHNTTLNPRISSRRILGIRHFIVPGPGQHIIDDEGHSIHVKPGDTIETSQLDALEAIPGFIVKRVCEQRGYPWLVNVIWIKYQASH